MQSVLLFTESTNNVKTLADSFRYCFGHSSRPSEVNLTRIFISSNGAEGLLFTAMAKKGQHTTRAIGVITRECPYDPAHFFVEGRNLIATLDALTALLTPTDKIKFTLFLDENKAAELVIEHATEGHSIFKKSLAAYIADESKKDWPRLYDGCHRAKLEKTYKVKVNDLESGYNAVRRAAASAYCDSVLTDIGFDEWVDAPDKLILAATDGSRLHHAIINAAITKAKDKAGLRFTLPPSFIKDVIYLAKRHGMESVCIDIFKSVPNAGVTGYVRVNIHSGLTVHCTLLKDEFPKWRPLVPPLAYRPVTYCIKTRALYNALTAMVPLINERTNKAMFYFDFTASRQKRYGIIDALHIMANQNNGHIRCLLTRNDCELVGTYDDLTHVGQFVFINIIYLIEALKGFIQCGDETVLMHMVGSEPEVKKDGTTSISGMMDSVLMSPGQKNHIDRQVLLMPVQCREDIPAPMDYIQWP